MVDVALQVVMPMARSFAPDLVIVSAGFDATEGDPLGGMRVSPAGVHLWPTSRLRRTPLLASEILALVIIARIATALCSMIQSHSHPALLKGNHCLLYQCL